MLNEEEFDSDTSDEDFVLENVHQTSSEADSEDELEELGQTKKRKNKKGGSSPVECITESIENIEDEKEVKERENKLWDDFLNDVEETPKPSSTKKIEAKSDSSIKTSNNSSKLSNKTQVENNSDPEQKTVKITKIFEFAGEEVKVEEEVAADSEEAKANDEPQQEVPISKGFKRAGASGLLDMLQNKRKKLSTLEKTKLDWNSFKKNEGLDDELELHKKSKSGYLEKQDFLARADLKQFEIEKELRTKNRKPL